MQIFEEALWRKPENFRKSKNQIFAKPASAFSKHEQIFARKQERMNQI